MAGHQQENNGLVSNIAFTHMQAMQLVNPEFVNANQSTSEHYFDQKSGFKTVLGHPPHQ